MPRRRAVSKGCQMNDYYSAKILLEFKSGNLTSLSQLLPQFAPCWWNIPWKGFRHRHLKSAGEYPFVRFAQHMLSLHRTFVCLKSWAKLGVSLGMHYVSLNLLVLRQKTLKTKAESSVSNWARLKI